jgi:hypothetical protein
LSKSTTPSILSFKFILSFVYKLAKKNWPKISDPEKNFLLRARPDADFNFQIKSNPKQNYKDRFIFFNFGGTWYWQWVNWG